MVIKDDAGNEWVWVPVEASVLSSMYVTVDSGVELSGNLGVTTKLYTNSATIGRAGDTVTITRGTPNTTEDREPDLVSEYDVDEKYYKTMLGFESAKAMAEFFVNDYAKMINSIKKYGGFYIGRYELSSEGVQKNKETLTGPNWYEFYKKCTTLNASSKVESRMICEIQWDLACDFISKKGEQKSIKDTGAWGNTMYAIAPANTGNYEKDTDGDAIKKNTGSNEAWQANNIYDLAGNCDEWTQGVSSQYLRTHVGGSCRRGNTYMIKDGASNASMGSGKTSTTRPVLIVK